MLDKFHKFYGALRLLKKYDSNLNFKKWIHKMIPTYTTNHRHYKQRCHLFLQNFYFKKIIPNRIRKTSNIITYPDWVHIFFFNSDKTPRLHGTYFFKRIRKFLLFVLQRFLQSAYIHITIIFIPNLLHQSSKFISVLR